MLKNDAESFGITYYTMQHYMLGVRSNFITGLYVVAENFSSTYILAY